MQSSKKLLIVTTSDRVVSWHLDVLLKSITDSYETIVVGSNVEVHSDNYSNVKFININIDRRFSILGDFFAAIQLVKITLKYRPDITHSIMPKAGLLGALSGFICRVPIRIHTYTGQVWVVFSGYLSWLYLLIDKLILHLNTHCLCDSQSQKDLLEKHGIHKYLKGPFVLGKGSLSGVDLTKYAEPDSEKLLDLKRTLGIKPGDFVFSYIARKVMAKGFFDVIKAFEVFKQVIPNASAKLLLIGPDEFGTIAEMVKGGLCLSKDIINLDAVPNVVPYLYVSDALCIPSLHEGFGSIVIDAGAACVPAIGYRTTGLIDSIDDGKTGLLVKLKDINQFADCMTLMYQDQGLVKKMGAAAKDRVVKHYNAQYVVGNLISFYDSCLSSK